jgi:hypothetical protein
MAYGGMAVHKHPRPMCLLTEAGEVLHGSLCPTPAKVKSAAPGIAHNAARCVRAERQCLDEVDLTKTGGARRRADWPAVRRVCSGS